MATDSDEHLESWSPEDETPTTSADLRLLGKVWRTILSQGGTIPDAIARKLILQLNDKDGMGERTFPAFLLRERRMFLDFLMRQEHHLDKMEIERARLRLAGGEADDDLDLEILLPSWAEEGLRDDPTQPKPTSTRSDDADADDTAQAGASEGEDE